MKLYVVERKEDLQFEAGAHYIIGAYTSLELANEAVENYAKKVNDTFIDSEKFTETCDTRSVEEGMSYQTYYEYTEVETDQTNFDREEDENE